MWEKEFWKDVADRAIRSAAQGFLLVFTAAYAAPESLSVLDVSGLKSTLATAAVAAVVMAILSVATSLATRPIGPKGVVRVWE